MINYVRRATFINIVMVVRIHFPIWSSNKWTVSVECFKRKSGKGTKGKKPSTDFLSVAFFLSLFLSRRFHVDICAYSVYVFLLSLSCATNHRVTIYVYKYLCDATSAGVKLSWAIIQNLMWETSERNLTPTHTHAYKSKVKRKESQSESEKKHTHIKAHRIIMANEGQKNRKYSFKQRTNFHTL